MHRFIGMFAFAIHDRDTGTVTLVRDRFGIKPLYYARTDRVLLFASEIKALLAALDAADGSTSGACSSGSSTATSTC